MRLINAASLELERFDGDTKIPPYAILSHTWGSAEVSLQQFQDTYMGDEHTRLRVKQMAGYTKIVNVREQALREGYAYVWVDTCCIDKTSSAELSEAINSMFRWYKNAEVCYAYLEDVPTQTCHSPLHSVYLDEVVSQEDLAGARWFTRGWTLQELVAPKIVRFFAAKWIFIGTKESMKDKLTRITSIDGSVLGGDTLDTVSVARRMSWAANRVTTRTEDLAYSLMGLFDVNMPLLYGEGQKAFVRLQEEILKDNEDQTLFAWTPSPERNIPFDYSGLGLSIFAKSPWEFVHGANFCSNTPRGEPPTVTNKGVRIDLPVLALKSVPTDFLSKAISKNHFLLVLYSSYSDDQLKHPAIVVRRVEPGSHTYVRHRTAAIFPIMHDEIRASDMRQVYLRRRSQKISEPLLRLDYRVSFINRQDERAKFVEARVYDPKDGSRLVNVHSAISEL